MLFIFQLFNSINFQIVLEFNPFLDLVIILLLVENILLIAAEVASIAKYLLAKRLNIGY